MSGRVRDAPLERLLCTPDLAADDALIALAGRFAGCDRAAVLAQLDDVARGLFGTTSLTPRARADRLAEALCDTLGLRPVTHEHRALLIDHALATGRAHPLVIAAIGHELGRRAGRRDAHLPRAHRLVARGFPATRCSRPSAAPPAAPAPSARCARSARTSWRTRCSRTSATTARPSWHEPAAELLERLPSGHHDDAH